jgi:type IV pilus assembly protein PilC
VPLPTFTYAVVKISEMLKHYGYVLLIPLPLILLFNKHKNVSPYSLQHIQKTLDYIPIIGSILQMKRIINFSRYLSVTLKAGLPISECISLIARASNNISFENALMTTKKCIETGHKIHHAMRNNTHFPVLMVEMIKIGEETGKLDYMLENISMFYENELDQLTTYLSDLLEPLIMVILGVLIGGLVIAMYLPIFKLGTTF